MCAILAKYRYFSEYHRKYVKAHAEFIWNFCKSATGRSEKLAKTKIDTPMSMTQKRHISVSEVVL